MNQSGSVAVPNIRGDKAISASVKVVAGFRP
jgi:hypothetical protein